MLLPHGFLLLPDLSKDYRLSLVLASMLSLHQPLLVCQCLQDLARVSGAVTCAAVTVGGEGAVDEVSEVVAATDGPGLSCVLVFRMYNTLE